MKVSLTYELDLIDEQTIANGINYSQNYYESKICIKFIYKDYKCKKFAHFFVLYSANNLVEVYINSHGTPSTRCPSSCHHQSRENISWHQLRSNYSHDSTMASGSAKKHSPGLRR